MGSVTAKSVGLQVAADVVRAVQRTTRLAVVSRLGRFKSWPPQDLLLSEPLALAEEKTDRLRRIYQKCTQNMWDGPAVFRDAVTRHGGIQLEREKRVALAHLVTPLMWGELGAWIVSAELAERLEDPDARMLTMRRTTSASARFINNPPCISRL